MDSLLEISRRPFLDLAGDVNGSVVYLDAGAAEVVQVTCGVSTLFGLGATNICSLEDAEADDLLLGTLGSGLPSSSIVVFVTQLLTDAHKDILRACTVLPGIGRCLVCSSLTEHAHACSPSATALLGVEAFREYSTLLTSQVTRVREQTEGSSFTVAVRHVPLTFCCLDSTMFLLPAGSAAAREARSGGYAAGFSSPSLHMDDAPGSGGGSTLSPGMSLMAHTLVSIATQLGYKAEAFALGPTAQQVAQEVATLPSPLNAEAGPGKAPPSMALVLVDRSLDLATPLMHHDHPLDCIMANGTRIRPYVSGSEKSTTSNTWRSVDVRVDAESLYPSSSLVIPEEDSPSEGSTPTSSGRTYLQERFPMGLEVFRPYDRQAVQYLEQMLIRKGKDTLFLLRKGVKDVLRTEKLTPQVRSKAAVSPSELLALVESLQGDLSIATRHRTIMTMALAAAKAMDGQYGQRWEASASIEKQLMMAVAEGSFSSAVDIFMDACRTCSQHKGGLLVADLLSLLIFMYSLMGDHGGQSLGGNPLLGHEMERMMQELLLDALMAAGAEDVSGVVALQHRIEQMGSAALAAEDAAYERHALRLEFQDKVQELFHHLQFVSSARGKLKDLRRILVSTDEVSVTPLVINLLDKILTEREVRDLHQATSSLRGFLNKGLGRFGLVHSRVKPSDFPVVVVFVLGGISMAEVRAVKETLSTCVGPRPHILFGGTSLLSPLDVADKLMC